MNNLELTEWLLKVRDALAEQDEVRRNSMLRTAEKFLKARKQQSRAFHRAGIGVEGGTVLHKSSIRNKGSNHRQGIN
jgi:hypothetical protein